MNVHRDDRYPKTEPGGTPEFIKVVEMRWKYKGISEGSAREVKRTKWCSRSQMQTVFSAGRT